MDNNIQFVINLLQEYNTQNTKFLHRSFNLESKKKIRYTIGILQNIMIDPRTYQNKRPPYLNELKIRIMKRKLNRTSLLTSLYENSQQPGSTIESNI